MDTTVPYAPKTSSGIDVVDESWGGFYQGGSYLVYGQADSGRGLVPLFFAREGSQQEERCLYVTSEPIDELSKRARRIGFDVQPSIDAGRLEVVQLPDTAKLDDDLLTRTLAELVGDVESKRPTRVAIDSFMPFMGFTTFGRFRTVFISMLDRIDATDATLMLTMSEPANDESKTIIAFMRCQTTASLHIGATASKGHSETREITLLPGIGHGGQSAVLPWKVEERFPDLLADQAAQGRRFRFADAEITGEDAPSLPDARWDPVEESSDATIEPAESAVRSTESPVRSTESDAEPSKSQRTPGSVNGNSGAGIADNGERLEFTTPPDLTHSRGMIGREAALEGRTDVAVQTDRERFRAQLQQRFLRSSINDVPFLLIAMRMDRREEVSTRPFDFEFIHDLVNELLRDQDDVYVDLDRERLIVLLADTDAGGSRPFFSELRRRLREEAPHQADYLLQSVSAIVVPNGRPFQNAEEFLSYALNEG